MCNLFNFNKFFKLSIPSIPNFSFLLSFNSIRFYTHIMLPNERILFALRFKYFKCLKFSILLIFVMRLFSRLKKFNYLSFFIPSILVNWLWSRTSLWSFEQFYKSIRWLILLMLLWANYRQMSWLNPTSNMVDMLLLFNIIY